MSHIFESFAKYQRDGIWFHLRLGNKVKFVRLRIPLFFVIGDGKSGDTLLGRYAAYNKGVGRIYRSCDCKFEDAGNPYVHCNNLKQAEFDKLYEDTQSNVSSIQKQAMEELHAVAQHRLVQSAFADLEIVPSPEGIFQLCPVDLMHAYLEGVMKHAITALIDPMTDMQKVEMDRTCAHLFRNYRQSERKNYPRANFTKGVTNLSMLAAHEWSGLAFVITLLSLTDKGEEVLSGRFDMDSKADDASHQGDYVDEAGHESDSSDNSSESQETHQRKRTHESSQAKVPSLRCFVELMETMLCFEAWYKNGPFWTLADAPEGEKAAKKAIAQMLDAIRRVIPRKCGQGWNLQKFHALLHVAIEITYWGSPQNFDAAVGERNHKTLIKLLCVTAQKWGEHILLGQLSARVTEAAVLHKASSRMGITQRSKVVSGILDVDNECPSAGGSQSSSHDTMSGSHTLHTREAGSNSTSSSSDGSHNWQLIHKNPLFVLEIDLDTNGFVKDWQVMWNSKQQGALHLHPSLEDFLCREYCNVRGHVHIECFPEVKHSSGVTFRSHPNYRSEGPWTDWAMVRWDVEGGVDADSQEVQQECAFGQNMYPAKILCFVRVTDEYSEEMDASGSSSGRSETIEAVVHSCEASDRSADSLIAERWTLEYDRKTNRPKYRAVPLQALTQCIFVVEECPGMHEIQPDNPDVLVVLDNCLHWPKKFLEPYKE